MEEEKTEPTPPQEEDEESGRFYFDPDVFSTNNLIKRPGSFFGLFD